MAFMRFMMCYQPYGTTLEQHKIPLLAISAVTKLSHTLLDIYPPLIIKHLNYARHWIAAEKNAWSSANNANNNNTSNRKVPFWADTLEVLKVAKRTISQRPWPTMGLAEIKEEFHTHMLLIDDILKASHGTHGLEMVELMHEHEPTMAALLRKATSGGNARVVKLYTHFTRWVAYLAHNKRCEAQRLQLLVEAQALWEKMIAASYLSSLDYGDDTCPECLVDCFQETGSALRECWMPDLRLAVAKRKLEMARELLKNKAKRKYYGHVHTYPGVGGEWIFDKGVLEGGVIQRLISLMDAYTIAHCFPEADATAREGDLEAPEGKGIPPEVALKETYELYGHLSNNALYHQDWAAAIQIAEGGLEGVVRKQCPCGGERGVRRKTRQTVVGRRKKRKIKRKRKRRRSALCAFLCWRGRSLC